MERLKVNAGLREVGKKGINRRLRREGLIPAILYGQGEKPLTISVQAKEFTTMIKKAGLNALIELVIEGDKKKTPLVVMLKDYQTDPFRQILTHIDLLKINLQEKVTVKIPLKMTGKAVGVTKGGLVEQTRRELEVKCLPGNIPEEIEIDISALDMGDSLHLKDIHLPEGVESVVEAESVLVSIVAPKEEEAPAPAAEVPAEGVPTVAATEAAAEAAAKGETKGEVKGEIKGEKK